MDDASRRLAGSWMKFYPGDFAGSPYVSLMSNEELGAHVRLLCLSWRLDGVTLVEARKVLHPHFETLWPGLEASWPPGEDGRLRDPWQEGLRREATERIGVAAARSRAGVVARRNPRKTRRRTSGEPPGQPQVDLRSTSGQPDLGLRSQDLGLRSEDLGQGTQDSGGESSLREDIAPARVRASRPPAKPGAATPYPDFKEAVDYWFAEFSRTRMGQVYGFMAKDGASVKALLKLAGAGGLAEVRRRMTALLESPDEFVAKHPTLGYLVGHWNEFAVEISRRGSFLAAAEELERQRRNGL